MTSQRCELSIGAAQRQAIRVRIERRPRWRERCRELVRRSDRFVIDPARISKYSQRLAQAGFGVASPLVSRRARRERAPGWLVLIEPAEAMALAAHLADFESQHPLDRLRLMIDLGREIARWHAAGFVHGRLAVEHVLFVPGARRSLSSPNSAVPRIGSKCRRCNVPTSWRRSSPRVSPPLATRAERNALLDSYLAAASWAHSTVDFRRQVKPVARASVRSSSNGRRPPRATRERSRRLPRSSRARTVRCGATCAIRPRCAMPSSAVSSK